MQLFQTISGLPTNSPQQRTNKRVLNLLKNPLINVYTPEHIIQLLNKDSLMKIQQFMRKNKTFKMTSFMRFFRQVLPFNKSSTNSQQQFFIFHALFKLFQEICNSKKKVQITFSDISSYIAQKMPNFVQQNLIKQKLLPFGLDIDQQIKSSIVPPQVYGQINQDHYFLTERPIKSDRIQHMSRDVGQSQYSKKHKIYFSIDKPSIYISILDNDLNIVHTLKTEQQMSKRDMIVNYIAWSDREQKIACILGNYSISMWSKEDNYKYQVNIPLPHQYLNHPFVIIKYMDSIKKWITLDNRPVIHVLRSRDYQPEYTFNNPKMRKKKQAQKIFLTQLNYLQLLCLGFERNLFLINLKNKQIVTQLHNFRTSITSLVFSQSYQALFVSTYQMYFRSYELSQYLDLIQKGKFQGHKHQISLLGIIQPKPIVFSLQQNSILKMFDMLDCTCYQSISVLKNILYKQVLYLQDAICLVGSKMHIYGLIKQIAYQQKQIILYISIHHKNLLIITNKCIRIYNIRNGSLNSVIRTVFDQTNSNNNNIYSAYNMQTKQKLFIQNQQGQCLILQTKQMNQIEKWNLNPKPLYMFYDQQNDLLTQVSLGNIYINQFHNQYCQKQIRRQIINQNQVIRYIKIFIKHDLIVVSYYGDDSMYFYAYQKGKMLGHLYFGEKKVVKFKNAYKPRKDIQRIIGIQFYEDKNLVFLLLSDQLLIMTYKRSISSMSFLIKKSIKLWQNPIKLKDHTQYIYPIQQYEQPLHSTGFAIFDKYITIISNKINIVATISYQINKIYQIQKYIINKDNYNPHRIGNQIHIGSEYKNPMVIIKDQTSAIFQLNYYMYKKKLGNFVMCEKVGNLMAIADDNLNIILLQNSNWSEISGLINCSETLPKLWNIFMYSKQEVQEVQFVLKFIENQDKIPDLSMVKSLMQTQSKINHNNSESFPKITIQQLIQQDKNKNKLKGFRSSSLRQKKMVLEKQRDQKDKLQQFLQKQRKQKKQNPNPSLKDNAHKQITDTIGYLSLNHNDTIANKGIIDQDYPVVKLLQKKLLASVRKQQKKSLASFQSGQSSFKTNKKIDKLPIAEPEEPKLMKTVSSEIYQGMTQRLGLKKYNSKQLLQTLHIQKVQSQRKLKSISKFEEKLPKIYKD